MKEGGGFSIRRHRRRVIALVVGYVLVTVLLGAVLIFFPLYGLLDKLHHTRLEGMVRGQAQAIEQHLQRISAVTHQVASRSMIRQWLSEYVAGRRARSELANLTNPRLADALVQSTMLAGIVRLGPAGEVVAAVGASVPASVWPDISGITSEIFFSDPLVMDNALWLLTAAPLLSDDGRRLGTDILLFSGATLELLVAENTDGNRNVCALGRTGRDGHRLFLLQQDGRLSRTPLSSLWPWLAQGLAAAESSGSGSFEAPADRHEPARTVAFQRLATSGWILINGLDRQAFTALAKRSLVPVAGEALLFALLGGGGIWLLLRPLFVRIAADTAALAESNDELRREIAERRTLAIALKRSEEAWSRTFEAITDPVTILAPDGSILQMNPASQALIDNFPAERRQKGICQLLCGKDGPDHDCPFTQMLVAGKPTSGTIKVAETGRIYQVVVYPLRGEDGRIDRGVHILRDITEQKQLEVAKEEMLSSLSHEIRTPLTAVIGFVEFLLENEVPRAEAVRHLRTTHHEAERLSTLFNDFLELQRLEAQPASYLLEDVPLAPLLDDELRSCSLAYPGHSMVGNYADDLPVLHADRRYLRRAVRNLLDNAVKYSPGGGLVELTAAATAEEVLIKVRDEGIGIPAASLESIFQRFYRVDDSDRRIPGGVGLGLPMVREVVRTHGGRVWAESVLGHGSTFFIVLPLRPDKWRPLPVVSK